MTVKYHDEINQAIANASEAMHRKDKSDAYFWASKAARLAPNLEEPWLIMAAVSEPQSSIHFLNRALEINPASSRAKQGIIWATKRLENLPSNKVNFPNYSSPGIEKTQKIDLDTPHGKTPKASQKPAYLKIILVWVGLCVIVCLAALTLTAFASNWLFTSTARSAPIPKNYLAKATIQPAETIIPTFTQQPEFTTVPTPAPSPVPTLEPTAAPTQPGPTAVPEVPAVPITPIATLSESAYVAGSGNTYVPAPNYTGGGGEGRWIDINLSTQSLYAFEGDTLINSFLISSGTAQHPTVTGQYRIYIKYRYDDMQGPGYYLPNVPFTMYFYSGYAIHGTYWHSNFGTPMSHGCVNMNTYDAGWLFDWASEGTLVNIHY